jgi:PAXIP1-associated protein, putative
MSKSDEDWVVNCSDEELYDVKNRMTVVKGKEVWEPSEDKIANLYLQIEKNGALDLKWVCPGRRSPSIHTNLTSENRKQIETNDSNTALAEPNQFDFDEEVNTVSIPKVNVVKRRSLQSKFKMFYSKKFKYIMSFS